MRITCFVVALALIATGGLVIPTGAASARPRQDTERSQDQVKAPPSKQQLLEEKNQRLRELELYVNQVRTAPPEIAADLLLRISGSERLSDKVSRIELIEEAFHLASRAKQPFKRKALSGNVVDTQTGYLSKAFGLGLDGLSLQCRAIKMMLALDKQKARTLFLELPRLTLQPLKCEDALIYDVSIFYDTLKDIVQVAFSHKEKQRDEHIWLMGTFLSAMESPSQVEPAAKALAALKISRSQLEALVHTFSIALEKIADDSRSFSYTLSSDSLFRSIEALALMCKGRDISRDELLSSFRGYLVKHLNSVACADSAAARGIKSQAFNYIEYFNTTLRFVNLPSQKEISAISEEDIKPTKIENAAKAYSYWRSKKASSLLMKAKNLRFSSGSTVFSDAEKQGTEWQLRLTDYLADVASWDPQDEKSEADYFHQKCILLRSLIELTPPGYVRDKVVINYIAFLSKSDLQRTNIIEWFLHADYLIKRANSSEGEERASILESMSKSQDAVFYLYAEIYRVEAEHSVN
jgi:hypothetical protein